MKNASAKTLLFLATLAASATAAQKPAPIASAQASSVRDTFAAAQAIDGRLGDPSRWVSQIGSGPHWLELGFASEVELAGLHLLTGSEQTKPLRDFSVQFLRGDTWVDIPSANVSGNTATGLALRFDDTVKVKTSRLRLYITGTADGIARVTEVVAWPLKGEGVPPLQTVDERSTPSLILLNQSGFNAGAPKRFTAPLAPDGTVFRIRPAAGGKALFEGTIKNHIGDFTSFEPGTSGVEYVVSTDSATSVPFGIGDWWLERITYQRAVDFMIDSRHYVGNDRRRCVGSYGWRDDHHFGWQLHTLVPQWLSHPSAYERMPRQIRYEAPQDPKLWGRLQPPAENAPDIVKLIHWGADVIVTQGTTHELMKSQLAYFLYAWPWLKAYLPAQNYEVVRDTAFEWWTLPKADHGYPYDESPEHNLLALKTRIGSTKGGYPPGFSIQPNLMMHAVAVREGRADAAIYLEAAVRQATWIVDNLDWNDPRTTKGQRMSEFITVTGLVHLLEAHPGSVPSGLRRKLDQWAEVALRRSENLWDFRKLGDEPDNWTPMGDRPTMWNEPGNVVGFPAIAFALIPHLSDRAAAARLEQIAWAHFDALFGRNPAGRHFSYDAPREIEGVEHGWYGFHVGGIGRLEDARFVIDGSPKNQHFPFRPEVGNVGWTEGWIQHNTPFNLSLAYLARHTSHIELKRSGSELVVRLEAAINFDPTKRETATVSVTSSNGDVEVLTVTEESVNSRFLMGKIKVKGSAAKLGDGTLQNAHNGTIEASYGFGYLSTRSTLAK
jgi:hypothetical protein